MSKNSDGVKKWRFRTKARLVASMGGKCVCCGYSKSQWALEFHHLNREEKKFSFGSMRASPRSWGEIVEEIKKCVLLCSNCHREVEHGIRNLPDTFPVFDESFSVYERTANPVEDFDVQRKYPIISSCNYCNERYQKKNSRDKYCSTECARLSTRVVKERPSKDVLLLMVEKIGYSAVGRKYGVSDNTIRKWVK